MSVSELDVVIRYILICIFVSAIGAVYEAYQTNWEAMVWAGLMFTSMLIGVNVMWLIRDRQEFLDYVDQNVYNTDTEEDYNYEEEFN